jgi:hypothetical protein
MGMNSAEANELPLSVGTCMGMFLSTVFFASIHGLVCVWGSCSIHDSAHRSRTSMPRGACQVRDMLSRTCMLGCSEPAMMQ